MHKVIKERKVKEAKLDKKTGLLRGSSHRGRKEARFNRNKRRERKERRIRLCSIWRMKARKSREKGMYDE